MALFIVPSGLAVDFEELDGSPAEMIYALGAGKDVVTRTLRCKAIDRARLIREFLGWIEYRGADVIVHRPHTYQVLTCWLEAQSADTIPKGRITGSIGDSRFADYELSHVVVKYSAPQLLQDAYSGLSSYRETLTTASEFATYPQENLYWGIGGGAVPLDPLDAPARITVMLEWIIEISRAGAVPNLPNYIGKINSAQETSYSGLVFAAGTLLCSGAESVQNIAYGTVGYTATYDISLRFLYRPTGWNFFPRPSQGGASVSWERITDGANNKSFYDSIDFSGIIFVPS